MEKGRIRSPSYPAIGLEEAIRKAQVVYRDVDRTPVSPEVLAEHWEYSPSSSGLLVAIAALKQFGLLTDEGKGHGRKLRLSDLACDLFIHDEDSDERSSAIKTAALNPKIHAELWEKFSGKLPSMDAAIRVYLLKGRKDEGKGEVFNKAAVDAFIRQFRSTVAFAGLASSDIISPVNGGESPEEGKAAMEKTSNLATPVPPKTTPFPPTDSGPVIFFPLSGGNALELRLRSKLSPGDFETVKKLIELSQASLVDEGRG